MHIKHFRFPETQDDSFRHGALQGNVVLVDGLLNGDHGKLGLFIHLFIYCSFLIIVI